MADRFYTRANTCLAGQTLTGVRLAGNTATERIRKVGTVYETIEEETTRRRGTSSGDPAVGLQVDHAPTWRSAVTVS